jgi:predicted nucleic-acid-binding protein
LVDWDIDISGREEVLNANSELFNLDFELKVNKTYQINNKTFNEITITIGEDVLEIMDVITFNKEFQIENITAYKR